MTKMGMEMYTQKTSKLKVPHLQKEKRQRRGRTRRRTRTMQTVYPNTQKT